MRLFLAIQLPALIRASLCRFIEVAKAAPATPDRAAGRIRWARAEGMHLTLKFLGETDLAIAGSILARVAEKTAGRFARMSLRVVGVGKFPGRGRPRVLFAGVVGDEDPDNAGRLQKLHALVAEASLAEGFPLDERPFHPHITLARFGDARPASELDHVLAARGALEFGRFEPESLTLFRSILSPQGAAYQSMKTVAL